MLFWAGMVVVLGLGTTGCSPASTGPLVGTREGGAASTVCVPASQAGRNYFGTHLHNTSTEPVVVVDVELTDHSNVGHVDWGIDHQGYSIGTASHPAEPGELDVGPMLARLSGPVGDVIGPDEHVTLVIAPIPESITESAIMRQIDITYRLDGREFVEVDETTFDLAPTNCFTER